MTIDASGVVRWTPALGDVGAHPVKVRALDGRGGSTTQEYLLIVNSP